MSINKLERRIEKTTALTARNGLICLKIILKFTHFCIIQVGSESKATGSVLHAIRSGFRFARTHLNMGRRPSGLYGGARARSSAALLRRASIWRWFSRRASRSRARRSFSQLRRASSTFSGLSCSCSWVRLSMRSSTCCSMSIVEIFACN